MIYSAHWAEVAELADAPALGAGGRKAVGVRVPSSARFLTNLKSNQRVESSDATGQHANLTERLRAQDCASRG
jgi:hypothetical protein